MRASFLLCPKPLKPFNMEQTKGIGIVQPTHNGSYSTSSTVTLPVDPHNRYSTDEFVIPTLQTTNARHINLGRLLVDTLQIPSPLKYKP